MSARRRNLRSGFNLDSAPRHRTRANDRIITMPNIAVVVCDSCVGRPVPEHGHDNQSGQHRSLWHDAPPENADWESAIFDGRKPMLFALPASICSVDGRLPQGQAAPGLSMTIVTQAKIDVTVWRAGQERHHFPAIAARVAMNNQFSLLSCPVCTTASSGTASKDGDCMSRTDPRTDSSSAAAQSQIGGWRSDHGRASSSCAANRKSVASSA